MELFPEKMIAANQAEYGELYHRMRFITAPEAAAAMACRAELLDALACRAAVGCQGSKLFTGELSPGCAACGAGSWSCLFINGICNGRCFYCPTSQSSKSEPMTNSLRFASPQDYLDYVAGFGFTGVGISGGEPFMTFDRTLLYVRKLKKKFGGGIHLWLYTNGMLATEEKMGQLQAAGLDEIRFDISADRYRLDHLKLAIGRIPRVTVEIPAIPEDYPHMRRLLPVLAEAGVNHLNLHQLRCTPHNLRQLLARNYIFSHGPRVTVPESELTALRLLLAACEAAGPAVNYCAYAYKGRFQAMAARRRAAQQLAAAGEVVTDTGFIRSLWLQGSAAAIGRLAAELDKSGALPELWRLEKDKLFFSDPLWPQLGFVDLSLKVAYYEPQLRDAVSYRGSYRKVPLNRKRTIIAERLAAACAREIGAAEREMFAEFFIRKQSGQDLKECTAPGAGPGESLKDIYEYERMVSGLPGYF